MRWRDWFGGLFRGGGRGEKIEERARLVGPEEFESIFESSSASLPRARSASAWVSAALRSPIIRPIVECIATDVAMGEYFLTDVKNGKRERLPDEGGSPAHQFLADPWKQGAGGSWEQLIKWFVCMEKSTGNIVALKDFTPSGKLQGLIPVPTPYCGCIERIAIRGTTQMEIWLHLTLPDTGRTVRAPLSDCFWHRNVHWSDPNGPGSAIVECLNDEVNQDEQAAKFNSAFFANGCTPHMIVSVVDKTMEQNQIDKLKAKWKKEYQGASNAFRALFVRGDLKVQPFQLNSRDAQIFEVRTQSRDFALMTFKMPPEIMGIKHQSGKTSTEEADKFYNKRCIRPEMKALTTSLNRQVFRPHYGSVRLGYVDPVREAAKDQLEKTVQSWTNGLIPLEVACAALGWPTPPPALAKHRMIPGNMFLVDESGKVVMQTTTPSGSTAAPSPGGATPSTTPPKMGNGTINKSRVQELALEGFWNGHSSLS